MLGVDFELAGQFGDERRGLLGGVAVLLILLREHLGMRPDRLAVFPPVEAERPARQAFTGIPLALAVEQQPVRREAAVQAAKQFVAEAALGRADGGVVPFVAVLVVDRNKSGLAAHRQ